MFKIEWDIDTGGVLLTSKVSNKTLGISPRPVFHEELDLLELESQGWTYPRGDAPVMWAVNKQYWYRGVKLFEAKGANIYDAPTVVLAKGVKPMALEAVDVPRMLERNAEQMFLIESEAIQFIRDTYTTYSGVNRTRAASPSNQLDFEQLAAAAERRTKQRMAVVRQDCDSFDVVPLDVANQEGRRVLLTTRIDRFIASFSGGKDSQVVLDLCTRAIPPTAFEVIYSDTGYELPPSLELYEEVKRYYGERFPSLRFTTTRNHESVLTYWDKIGTPSDTHRWCCSVMKTAPLYRSLKVEGNKQARVLVFDGVRAEESIRRAGYDRIGKGVKHSTVINASPILYWNSAEIFLYLMSHDLSINPAYRVGVTRVGCVICPFSSEWNDMVINKIFSKSMSPFLSKVEERVAKLNIPDPENYVRTGNWKLRAGGRDMKPDSSLRIVSNRPDLIIEVINAHKKLTTWFSAIGEFVGNPRHGTIRFDNTIFSYEINKVGNVSRIIFLQSSLNALFQGLVKRAVYKACFCINCEACEVECPTGALSIIPEAEIDKEKCIHCQKCLTFHELGCVVAHSLKITNTDTTKMKLAGYNNFGLKEEWLDYFMINTDGYFDNNDHGLNPMHQLPSFTKWLIHSGIIADAKSKNITELGKILVEIYKDNPSLVWEIIWINLTYNSPIVKWYAKTIPFNREIADMELKDLVKIDYPNTSDQTIKNVVYALVRTLRESPIGEDLYQYMHESKQNFVRRPYADVSIEAIAYSLYRYGESKNTDNFRISTIMSDTEYGPKVEFGIDRTQLAKQLRTLHMEGRLIAELNMGLDHITLLPNRTAIEVLKDMTDL